MTKYYKRKEIDETTLRNHKLQLAMYPATQNFSHVTNTLMCWSFTINGIFSLRIKKYNEKYFPPTPPPKKRKKKKKGHVERIKENMPLDLPY